MDQLKVLNAASQVELGLSPIIFTLNRGFKMRRDNYDPRMISTALLKLRQSYVRTKRDLDVSDKGKSCDRFFRIQFPECFHPARMEAD